MRFTIFAAICAFLLWETPAFAGQHERSDGDGVADNIDNCIMVFNAFQDDTDLDDCGNLCDADYDNDGIVGILDFGQFGAAYLTNDEEKCHLDGSIAGCTVGIFDFGFFANSYLTVPGPSGTTIGTVACP